MATKADNYFLVCLQGLTGDGNVYGVNVSRIEDTVVEFTTVQNGRTMSVHVSVDEMRRLCAEWRNHDRVRMMATTAEEETKQWQDRIADLEEFVSEILIHLEGQERSTERLIVLANKLKEGKFTAMRIGKLGDVIRGCSMPHMPYDPIPEDDEESAEYFKMACSLPIPVPKG